MKKCKSIRNLIISIFWIMVGATLIVLGVVETLDEFWSGFGGGLVAVGILQLVRNIRYRTNDDYKEKVDTEINDERNQFISSQAWAWTGYIFIICCFNYYFSFYITISKPFQLLLSYIKIIPIVIMICFCI